MFSIMARAVAASVSDWTLLQGQDLRNVILAGGLGADNCVEAAKAAVPDSISIQA